MENNSHRNADEAKEQSVKPGSETELAKESNQCDQTCNKSACWVANASGSERTRNQESESHRFACFGSNDNTRECDCFIKSVNKTVSVWTVTLTRPQSERHTIILEDSVYHTDDIDMVDNNGHIVSTDRPTKAVVYDIISCATDAQIDNGRSISTSPTGRVGEGHLVLQRLMGGWYNAAEPSPLADRVTALIHGNTPISDRWAVAIVLHRPPPPGSQTVTIYVEDDKEGVAATELAEFLDVPATPAYAGLHRI